MALGLPARQLSSSRLHSPPFSPKPGSERGAGASGRLSSTHRAPAPPSGGKDRDRERDPASQLKSGVPPLGNAGGTGGIGDSSAVLVSARFRPLPAQERGGGKDAVVLDLAGHQVSVEVDESSGAPKHTFAFDRILGPEATQAEVFDVTTRPIVEEVLSGYYATVFAYGQTGSGKTYTMEGQLADPELRGIIPRSIECLFEHISCQNKDVYDFNIVVSYVEIYRERIRCLLDRSKTKENLEIRMDLARGVYVDGASERVVSSDTEVLEALVQGSRARHTAATLMNEESSRSHAIFMVTVSQKDLRDLTQTTGKIFFVDLAGSETVSKTGACDERLEEAKHINKSLSALGNVIKALTEVKTTYVPYRDSKLTRMLQDSLGGSSRTSLIINCSSSPTNASETLSTLRFGSRAKRVRNKPRQHVGYGGTELEEILMKREAEIGRLRVQVDSLSEEVKRLTTEKAVTSDALQSSEHSLREETEKYKAAKEVVEQLERQMLVANRGVERVTAHLTEEEFLFGELRSYFSRLTKKLDHTDPQVTGQAAKLDKLLSMASWRTQQMLRDVAPVAEVAPIVEASKVSLERLEKHVGGKEAS